MMCSSQPPECDSEFNSIGSVPGSVSSEIVREAETVFQSLSSELRLHNSCLPIAKLPNELLINIIHRSLYGLEKEYFIRLWSLSQVSTLWYDLVKHSPTLWGYTHSEHTTTEVELALRRSKGALIDVVYVHKGDEPYLEAVLKERSRWRSFRFKIRHETRSTDLLGYLSQGIFEHLEEVDLTYLPIGWYPLLLDNPIGPHMPRLRHLRLSDITVAWDSDIPSNLDTLSLIFVDWGSGPSTKQVMGILHASPSLTSLQLRCYEMPPGAPYSPTTISLPRLHTLDLDLPVWKAGQLFTSLDIPFCRRFNLHFVAERPEEFYSVGCKILSSMLTSATGIHLDISSWKITFK
ncbi:hypothetical protein FRB94_002447 [Tulasnella sp. JGI-2019a]|nr:hypothetical protein FRB94_002447 [Tulasnella sp. JGI-2019a]